MPRIDFFLAEAAGVLREEKVFADAKQKLEERISHEPLGVIANISAWNYPYFVGGNVFVPALLAGNAVLYKPSEFATLTGLHIAELLHEAGVPDDVFIPVVGGGATGAALLRQPVDGVFFTGSYATGAKIGAAAGRRMIKVQLELGGKDPVYVCDDVDVKSRRRAASPTARSTTPGSRAARSSASTCTRRSTTRSSRRSSPRSKASRSAIRSTTTTYIGPITRRPQLDVLQRQVADAKRKGATLLTGGKRHQAQGQLVRADGACRRRSPDGADAGRELRPDHRHPESRRRRRGGRD